MPLNVTEGAPTPPGLAAGIPEPQPVLGAPTTAAAFLVVSVPDAPGAAARAVATASAIGDLVRAVGFREPTAGLTCVVGVGAGLWDRVRPAGSPRPAQLHPFRALRGARHDAPATPGDLLFHVRADRGDLVFELVRLLLDALGDDVRVEDHTTGFRYFDSRDLLGFVDGTENPTGRDATEAALIDGAVEPDFAGGSYVVVQKYLHDLAAWGRLSTEEQERIVGRTKLDDVELDDAHQPPDSHVTLNTITDADGNGRDVLRDNMAFGDPATGEMGTYYIAYAADLAVTEQMLVNMFVGNPPGLYDKILDVSTAVTGSVFFVPSRALLESLADTLADADADTPADSDPTPAPRPARPAPTADDLGIGSLKGATP